LASATVITSIRGFRCARALRLLACNTTAAPMINS
jgi:hypothetical protein